MQDTATEEYYLLNLWTFDKNLVTILKHNFVRTLCPHFMVFGPSYLNKTVLEPYYILVPVKYVSATCFFSKQSLTFVSHGWADSKRGGINPPKPRQDIMISIPLMSSLATVCLQLGISELLLCEPTQIPKANVLILLFRYLSPNYWCTNKKNNWPWIILVGCPREGRKLYRSKYRQLTTKICWPDKITMKRVKLLGGYHIIGSNNQNNPIHSCQTA